MLPSSWPWTDNMANHAPATHGICPDSLCPLIFYVTLCLKSFLTHFYKLNQFTDEESERRRRRISSRLPVTLVKEREQGLKRWRVRTQKHPIAQDICHELVKKLVCNCNNINKQRCVLWALRALLYLLCTLKPKQRYVLVIGKYQWKKKESLIYSKNK